MEDINKLSDAHTHFSGEEDLKKRIENKIVSLVSNANIEEYKALLAKDLPSFIIPTFGIHPWSSDKYQVNDFIDIFKEVKVIGEIGMDSVWCDVDLKLQEEVFKAQLALALKLKKAVILHTKGQEKEIAALIHKYPNKYLVHWYSSSEHLEDYIREDCYFSIGPDVLWNKAAQNVARTIPTNRLLIETDGLGAIKWAYDEGGLKINEEIETYKALIDVAKKVADIRNISLETCLNMSYENLINGFLI